MTRQEVELIDEVNELNEILRHTRHIDCKIAVNDAKYTRRENAKLAKRVEKYKEIAVEKTSRAFFR